MLVKYNISFGRKHTHICRAERILNTRTKGDSKKPKTSDSGRGVCGGNGLSLVIM